MNNKVRLFINDFSYTLTSNVISLLISTLVILIIPKVIGVEEYGYWQLYLFYSGYVGFFHFGWIDGIYLRFGGKEYKNLDKFQFFSQFWMLMFLQLFVLFCISILIIIFIEDKSKIYILNFTLLCGLIVIPKTFLAYILQFTNRIKEYATITIIDRLTYFLLIIILLITKETNFELMISADLIGKCVSLIFAVLYCKDIVFNRLTALQIDFREAYENIRVGIKLLLSNLSGMLIIGIVRLGIESTWDVETFGKISLTISVSNLMMIFINAIGIIMFPMLRRMDKEKLPQMYTTLRSALVIPLLAALTVYFPLNKVLSIWLPQYSEGLTYMALLFPICLYEGKMSLIVNTYLKTLREEKMMLIINAITVTLSIISSIIVIVCLENLTLAVLSIVGLMGFRSIVAELFLSNILKVKIWKDIFLETSMTFVFVLTGWYLEPLNGMVIYLVAYACFFIFKLDDVKWLLKKIEGLKT